MCLPIPTEIVCFSTNVTNSRKLKTKIDYNIKCVQVHVKSFVDLVPYKNYM